MRRLALAAAFSLMAGTALAQTNPPLPGDAFRYQSVPTPTRPGITIQDQFNRNRLAPNPDGSLNVRPLGKPMPFVGGSYTLSNSSAIYVPPDPARQWLMIDNPNASINVACAFGAAAATNTGGSLMVPAGVTRTWPSVPGGPVPTDYIACIAASGSPTITISVGH